MPRTCLACSSPERPEIDKALVTGEPLRNIAKRVSISPAGLLRHKCHVSQAIAKANEKREERFGDNLLDEMRRVQHKAWELLARTESEGDHRGAIVALRDGCVQIGTAFLPCAGSGASEAYRSAPDGSIMPRVTTGNTMPPASSASVPRKPCGTSTG